MACGKDLVVALADRYGIERELDLPSVTAVRPDSPMDVLPSTMEPIPEVWLRGSIPGIQPYLQPAAHTLQQVREDIEAAVQGLTTDQLWHRPGGSAAIGFHLHHLPGSLERLLTYSRGESLSPDQMTRLGSERTVHEDRPSLDALLTRLTGEIERALDYLRSLPQEALLQRRDVGRKKLPSTTLGLIFHAAEHSSRHAGQVVTLARIVSPPAP
jgi:uncharacterized damage-inducible protein DinB